MERNLIHLWQYHTPEQNDLLVVRLFTADKLDVFTDWLKDGLELNAFMLSNLIFHHRNGDKAVVTAASVAQKVSSDAKKWLKNYLSSEEVLKIIRANPQIESLDFPNNDFCVEHKLWDVLRLRNEFKLLAIHDPEAIFSYNDVYPYRVLLSNNPDYFDRVFEKGEAYYAAFFTAKDGWKYLIDHGQVSYVLARIESIKLFDSLAEEVLIYCLKRGFFDELYQYKQYDFLLEHGQFSVFVQNNSCYKPFLLKYPDVLSWNHLWNYVNVFDDAKALHEHLLRTASEVLSQNPDCKNVRYFLKEHSTWRWLKSYFQTKT